MLGSHTTVISPTKANIRFQSVFFLIVLDITISRKMVTKVTTDVNLFNLTKSGHF